jgi:hypothetical protein
MTTEPSLHACLLGLSLLFGVGCRAALQRSGGLFDTSRIPAEIRKDYPVFAANCSKCHDLSRALNAPIHDVEHWNRYVARMARTPGSGISPAESPHILSFLHWYTRDRVARAEQAKVEGDKP